MDSSHVSTASKRSLEPFLLRAPSIVRPTLLPGGLPLRSAASLRFTLFVKELSDRVLALFLMVVGFPLLLAGMLAVKLTSRGPAIYSQKRVGQFGRVFTIYKIRTMRHDCESKTGPRWAAPRDSRVTKVGRVLRKLHIDELPQLWNVLKGEMSLLGPRPERPEIAVKLKSSIDEYDYRLSVKPGISGLAQIHLPPDTCLQSVRDKLVLDREYIQAFSLWRDCKVYAATALKAVGLKPCKKAGPVASVPGERRQDTRR